MPSFFKRQIGGEKRWPSCGGDFNICPLLHQLLLPCHSQRELSSPNGLKVWREGQKPHNDIAFLLVKVENAMGDRHYGLSFIWANPSQVRVASMEDVVRKLTACTSSWTKSGWLLWRMWQGN